MAIAQNFPNIAPSLSLDFAAVQALDPRISFSRASTATYYGTRTAVAEQNLLLYSQEFDNAAWTKTATTATANSTTAPDGTTTADTLIPNTTNTFHAAYFLSSLVAGVSYTASVFVKDAGYNTFVISDWNEATRIATFDLTNVTATISGSGATVTLANATITSVGNGWYRCTVQITKSTAGQLAFFPSSASSFAGDGTSGIFIWGAQLEQRSTVTAYTPTTTQPITNYIPVLETAASGVARFDHNPTTFESLGLLIEQQSTNLLTYSEDFSNAAWTKSNATITANQVIAPNGTLTASQFFEDSATNIHYMVAPNAGYTSGTTYTQTIYAKAGTASVIQIFAQFNNWPTQYANFDLANGVVGSVSGFTASMTAVGNGWYRIGITTTASGSSAASIMFLGFTNNSTTATRAPSYAGNSGQYISIWGAQLEALNFSTSYIPTVASQVTRAADSASMTGTNFSSWYNQAQGTLYTESTSNGLLSVGPISVEIGDGTINNRIVTGQFIAGAVRSLLVNTGNVVQALLDNSANPLLLTKSAGSYKFNDFFGAVNGGTVLTDTVGLVPLVDRVTIGNNTATANQNLNGRIRKIAYYPIALTSTQIQALTS